MTNWQNSFDDFINSLNISDIINKNWKKEDFNNSGVMKREENRIKEKTIHIDKNKIKDAEFEEIKEVKQIEKESTNGPN